MKRRLCALALAACAASGLRAFDLWRWPEAAEKNSLFLEGQIPFLSLDEGLSFGNPEFIADWLPPFFLPVSLGAYFAMPDPNLKNFGARAGYHFDIDLSNIDLYALYVFDFGFTRNSLLEEYGDEPQDIRYFDFRAGIRRLFGKYMCLVLETGYHLQTLRVGISIKAN